MWLPSVRGIFLMPRKFFVFDFFFLYFDCSAVQNFLLQNKWHKLLTHLIQKYVNLLFLKYFLNSSFQIFEMELFNCQLFWIVDDSIAVVKCDNGEQLTKISKKKTVFTVFTLTFAVWIRTFVLSSILAIFVTLELLLLLWMFFLES